MQKEHANNHAGPRADDLRNFKPFKEWLQEKRTTFDEWERRQPKQRGNTHVGVLRMKLNLAEVRRSENG